MTNKWIIFRWEIKISTNSLHLFVIKLLHRIYELNQIFITILYIFKFLVKFLKTLQRTYIKLKSIQLIGEHIKGQEKVRKKHTLFHRVAKMFNTLLKFFNSFSAKGKTIYISFCFEFVYFMMYIYSPPFF